MPYLEFLQERNLLVHTQFTHCFYSGVWFPLWYLQSLLVGGEGREAGRWAQPMGSSSRNVVKCGSVWSFVVLKIMVIDVFLPWNTYECGKVAILTRVKIYR